MQCPAATACALFLFLATAAECVHCGATDTLTVTAPEGSKPCQHSCNDVEFLPAESNLLGQAQHITLTWFPWSQTLRLVSGSISLAGLWLMLYVGSPETLVIAAIFLDVLMTTILTPLAPTLTPSYQKIAVLTSSKNVVTCLIAPFVGSYIDGNEAKSMQHGMLCAMICSLGLAVATWQRQLFRGSANTLFCDILCSRNWVPRSDTLWPPLEHSVLLFGQGRVLHSDMLRPCVGLVAVAEKMQAQTMGPQIKQPYKQNTLLADTCRCPGRELLALAGDTLCQRLLDSSLAETVVRAMLCYAP